MRSVKNFCKKETVLVISGILAILSCLVIPPSKAYLGYINYRVLVLLFCLMTVVAGEMKAGTFDLLSNRLLWHVRTMRGLSEVLVIMSFIMSMFLTNDVTLVTVVPFTLMVFRRIDHSMENGFPRMFVLIMETVAANLGSMLTPFGNPQNLYLYARYDYHMGEFIRIMLPYTAVSLVLIFAATLLMKDERVICSTDSVAQGRRLDLRGFVCYLILFLLCIFSVARILDYRILLVIVSAAVLLLNRRLFTQVDYSLLLTFVFFFVFIGNVGKIEMIRAFLEKFMSGRELLTAIITSQFVSNVPAAILLSGFTQNGRALVVGTNLGGLGTLIASMASLITYKFYAAEKGSSKKRYLLYFTAVNLIFLILLYLLSFFLR
ncbi:MAG: citrate transporter [Butyrivibrio sp.]|nr:citrate transporter [Butyrivibrio sp.]